MKIAIIGGGAAGFFAAIAAKGENANAEVNIYEKSNKVLSKVKVSGGGRCNLTHACFEINELIKNYPRGSNFLKKAFHQFNSKHCVEWFENRGVKLKTEKDNRMFPVSNSSQTVIDCLLNEAKKLGVEVQLSRAIREITPQTKGFLLELDAEKPVQVNKIIVATGGAPKVSGFTWLSHLGHNIIPPVPSLFTFNMPAENITDLMGTVAQNTRVKIHGYNYFSEGPLLVTHWGMSGPAILKLSAFAARELSARNYDFNLQVTWLNDLSEGSCKEWLTSVKESNIHKRIKNFKTDRLPKRLWLYLLDKAGIEAEKTWRELSKKSLNRWINILLNDVYSVKGKTTFKEEFVTCGGVDIKEINPKTMESKIVPNLYFAGEVLDIDGITGGFNFQNAWTTGYIAGKSASSSLH